VRPPVHQAAELIIGNLNEEGYLIASDEELLGIAPVAPPEADVEVAAKIVGEAEALGLAVAGNPRWRRPRTVRSLRVLSSLRS
jgi:DNA-directed RNA polymerase specialized sigma54-like protein